MYRRYGKQSKDGIMESIFVTTLGVSNDKIQNANVNTMSPVVYEQYM